MIKNSGIMAKPTVRIKPITWWNKSFVLKSTFGIICCISLIQCRIEKSSSSVPHPSMVAVYDGPTHFGAIYAEAEMKYSFKGTSHTDFIKWQKGFRSELKKLLGLDILERELSNYQSKGEKISSEDIGFATREHWLIWTEPTVPLPFILLRPKNIGQSNGLIITPHGHSRNTELYAGIYTNEAERESGEKGERNVAVQAVKEGYFAIAPTTRGFGQTRTPEDQKSDATSSCRTLLMHDLLVGRTPIGDRVWDLSKIIDWALANLPVDHEKIAVTGNSGGGTVTLFAAACDTRIKMALPSSYFCTFTGSIGSLHHCDCNYVPGILQLGEMADVAGLIAPRPFCAIQGKLDKIFPIEESQKAFDQLKKIYSAAGAPDKCELYIGSEGHRYYKDGVWPFVRKYFRN
jgi:dienelactone hydrolase